MITVLKKDYSPQPAEDGKTAWDELSKNNGSSSLLITDGWNLPGINGYELTELVRKDKRYVNMSIRTAKKTMASRAPNSGSLIKSHPMAMA